MPKGFLIIPHTSPEFKTEAIRLLTEQGYKTTEAPRDFAILSSPHAQRENDDNFNCG